MRKRRTPWILKLPLWARRNPLGLFIALLCVLSGLLYALNVATSNSITDNLHPLWLQLWGAFLAVGGVTKLFGNVRYSYPAEKLGCRLISLSVFVYAAWVAVTSGWLATTTITLALSLVAVMEIRVAVINLVLSPPPEISNAK